MKRILKLVYLIILVASLVVACNTTTHINVLNPNNWAFFKTPTSVSSIAFDSQGSLWIGGDNIIIKLDITNGDRETYYFDNMPNISDIIFESNENAWIGSKYSTVQRYKNRQWVIEPARSPLFLSGGDSVWTADKNSNVLRFEADERKCYHINSDTDSMVISIVARNNDEVWVSLMQKYWEGQESNKDVWQYNGQEWTEVRELSEEWLHYHILLSSDGSVWFVAPKVIEGSEKPGKIKKLLNNEWVVNAENYEYTPILAIAPAYMFS